MPGDTIFVGHTLRGTDILELMEQIPYFEIAHLGGAGNKCLHLAYESIDSYMNAYLDFWDLCGGDVIVRAVGGHSSDFDGNLLSYIETDHRGTCLYSAIFTINKTYFDSITSHLGY